MLVVLYKYLAIALKVMLECYTCVEIHCHNMDHAMRRHEQNSTAFSSFSESLKSVFTNKGSVSSKEQVKITSARITVNKMSLNLNQ